MIREILEEIKKDGEYIFIKGDWDKNKLKKFNQILKDNNIYVDTVKVFRKNKTGFYWHSPEDSEQLEPLAFYYERVSGGPLGKFGVRAGELTWNDDVESVVLKVLNDEYFLKEGFPDLEKDIKKLGL